MKEIQTLFNVKKTYQNHEISTKKFKIISNFKNAIYNQYLADIVCIIKKIIYSLRLKFVYMH